MVVYNCKITLLAVLSVNLLGCLTRGLLGKGSRASVSAWKEAFLSDVTAGDGKKGKAAAAWIRRGVQGCWGA